MNFINNNKLFIHHHIVYKIIYKNDYYEFINLDLNNFCLNATYSMFNKKDLRKIILENNYRY